MPTPQLDKEVEELQDDIEEWKERVTEELFVNQNRLAGELILEEFIDSVKQQAITTTIERIDGIIGENDIHDATHNPAYPKERGYGECTCDLQETNKLRAKQRQALSTLKQELLGESTK